MRRLPAVVVLGLALVGEGAFAQDALAQVFTGPGMTPVIPYPTAPPPPPPPAITVPQVPKMESPPPFELQNTKPGYVKPGKPPAPVLKPQRQRPLSDRVARCLDEGAMLGLSPNERAAYSRSCALR